jgi:hypothetical protein
MLWHIVFVPWIMREPKLNIQGGLLLDCLGFFLPCESLEQVPLTP